MQQQGHQDRQGTRNGRLCSATDERPRRRRMRPAGRLIGSAGVLMLAACAVVMAEMPENRAADRELRNIGWESLGHLYAGESCAPQWDQTIGQPGMNDGVGALLLFDDGTGPALYAGGSFTTAGGIEANRIARWDGATWSPLGSGMNSNSVSALAVFEDSDISNGSPVLYAAGFFTMADGKKVNRIAKWNGETWSALGSGMNGGVQSLAVFDDGAGSGPALYVGGQFTTAGDTSANRIARWGGAGWSALSSGMSGGWFSLVGALIVFDDGQGSGPALYAGGAFYTAGGVTVNHIARWNGTTWSALGSGMTDGSQFESVRALAVFDDGSGGGPALYAGGDFTTAGGVSANNIAKWNHATGQWSALGSGVNAAVNSLAVFDDGSGDGPALYAGGNFTTAGGENASRIAKWNGTAWSAVDGGTLGSVVALEVVDDETEGGVSPGLYAGGTFTFAGGLNSNRIARWACEIAPECAPADLNCDGVVNVADLLILFNNWGACDDCTDCPADLNDDCVVNVADLLIMFNNWG